MDEPHTDDLQEEIKIKSYILDDTPSKVLGHIEIELTQAGLTLMAKAISTDRGGFFIVPPAHKINDEWIQDWHLGDEAATKNLCEQIRNKLSDYLQEEDSKTPFEESLPF